MILIGRNREALIGRSMEDHDVRKVIRFLRQDPVMFFETIIIVFEYCNQTNKCVSGLECFVLFLYSKPFFCWFKNDFPLNISSIQQFLFIFIVVCKFLLRRISFDCLWLNTYNLILFQVVDAVWDCKSEVIGPGAYRFKAEIGQ